MDKVYTVVMWRCVNHSHSFVYELFDCVHRARTADQTHGPLPAMKQSELVETSDVIGSDVTGQSAGISRRHQLNSSASSPSFSSSLFSTPGPKILFSVFCSKS